MSKDSVDCRYCGCRRNRVDKTLTFETSYKGKDRTVIRRHRVCENCGLRFTTVETLESEEQIGLPETVNFINLKVKDKAPARNPLDSVQEDLPTPIGQQPPIFMGRLGIPVEGFNPLIHTSPKKDKGPSQDLTPRSEGHENGSLGKQLKKTKRK